jgi:hypothetical protein
MATNTSTKYNVSTEKIPRIDLNLREHKLAIGIQWSILVTSSCIVPIVLYFALRYGADLEAKIGIFHLNGGSDRLLMIGIALGVATGIFGAASLFSLGKRTYLLLKNNSTCRPLGSSRAAVSVHPTVEMHRS